MASDRVSYLQADLFDWEPERTCDLVFLGFGLSHVPRDRFGAFWEKVGRALASRGQVFLVDNLRTPIRLDSEEDPAAGAMARELEDGRSFRIVKIFYDPMSPTRMLEPAGWSCGFKSAGRYLLYGTANRPR